MFTSSVVQIRFKLSTFNSNHTRLINTCIMLTVLLSVISSTRLKKKNRTNPRRSSGLSEMLLFCRSVVSDPLWPHGAKHVRCPCPSPSPRACSDSSPLNWWCHPTISSSPSPPAFNLSQHQGLFKGVSSSHQTAKVLEFQLQHQSFQWIFGVDFL